MMTLDEARAHVGEAVTCHPAGGEPERGTIAAVSTVYVFVQYPGVRGVSVTYPEDLTLVTAGEGGEDDEDDPEAAALRLEAAEERAFNAQLPDWPDLDCGLGPERCRAAEDGDLGG